MRKPNGEPSPERLERIREQERKQLESYVDEALHYLGGSAAQSMRLERAITEVFRQRNMGSYPEKTLDALREKIRAEVERRVDEAEPVSK